MSLFKRNEIFFRTDEHRDFFLREVLLTNRRNIRFIPVLFIAFASFFLVRLLLPGGGIARFSKASLVVNLAMMGVNLLSVPFFIRPVRKKESSGFPRFFTLYLTLQCLFVSSLTFIDMANGYFVIILPVSLVFLAAVLWLDPGIFGLYSGVMILFFCATLLYPGTAITQPLSFFSSVLIAYLCIWFIYLHIRSLRMENIQNRISLEEQYQSKEIEGAADPLTGLFNRRYLKDDVEKELARSSRSESPFCLAFLDMDHFRSVNDNFGYMAGDEVLREASHLLRNSVRLSDKIYRYSGERFLLLLPDTVEDEAVILGQRIREKFEAYHFKTSMAPLTVSIGITRSQNESSVDLLIKRAEGHLKTAKDEGRNRVVCDSCPPRN